MDSSRTSGFGNGRLVGICSWIGYLAGNDACSVWNHVFTTAIILAMAAVNFVGTGLVDRSQRLIVFIPLGSSASSSR